MSVAMYRLIPFPFAATAWTLPWVESNVGKTVDALARAAETGRRSGFVLYSTLWGGVRS